MNPEEILSEGECLMVIDAINAYEFSISGPGYWPDFRQENKERRRDLIRKLRTMQEKQHA